MVPEDAVAVKLTVPVPQRLSPLAVIVGVELIEIVTGALASQPLLSTTK